MQLTRAGVEALREQCALSYKQQPARRDVHSLRIRAEQPCHVRLVERPDPDRSFRHRLKQEVATIRKERGVPVRSFVATGIDPREGGWRSAGGRHPAEPLRAADNDRAVWCPCAAPPRRARANWRLTDVQDNSRVDVDA